MKRDCECPRARHQHGTTRAYAADNCRCTPCRQAHSRALKVTRLRVHRVGAHSELVRALPIGTTRRLQALAATGWSANDLAPLLHTAAPNIIRWRTGRHTWVRPATLQRVVDVYDRIWDQPPPGRYAAKVRNLAAREGWLPALAWDDDEIDNPKARPHKGNQRGGSERKPCGTLAAARRHRRRGEGLDETCRKAETRREDAA